MDLNFIKTLVTICVALGTIALATGLIVGQFKKGKADAQEDLNDTLNELLKARDTKIKDLEDAMAEQGKKIAYLAGQVETLSSQKTDMEILIKTALKEHFAAHPDMAVELQGKMSQ